MAQFQDDTGHKWIVDITFHTAKRLRASGRDLMDMERVVEILADPIELFDLLYLVCEEQAQKSEVSEAEFGGRMVKCAMEAMEALKEAIVNFFRTIGRMAAAEAVNRIWAAAKMSDQKGVDLVMSRQTQAALDNQISKAIAEAEAELQRMSGETSTG